MGLGPEEPLDPPPQPKQKTKPLRQLATTNVLPRKAARILPPTTKARKWLLDVEEGIAVVSRITDSGTGCRHLRNSLLQTAFMPVW